MARVLLALALVLGMVPRAETRPDPAFALAMVAGALCQGDGPQGLPSGHVHDHCLACQGTGAGAAVGGGPALPAPAGEGRIAADAAVEVLRAIGWCAYASRAPPAGTG